MMSLLPTAAVQRKSLKIVIVAENGKIYILPFYFYWPFSSDVSLVNSEVDLKNEVGRRFTGGNL